MINAKRLRAPLGALATGLSLLLGACAPTSVAPPPSPTVAPPASQPPSTSGAPTAISYTTITILDIGLSYEVPAGWQRLGDQAAWGPPGQGTQQQRELRIGEEWAELQPPQEPEAVLLPTPSQIVSSEPVELAWGNGRRITLEVLAPTEAGQATRAPVEAYQIHVLIVAQRPSGRLAVDFYATGETPEQLAEMEPLLDHMVSSSVLLN